MIRCLLLTLGLIVFGNCADTGQDRATVPLYVAGSALPDTVLTMGDVPITIQRAELAFGPLYLCAGAQAGQLCETARLEWLETTVVNALEPSPELAGTLDGVTGQVQSWMYDLGISSQLTQSEPFVLDAAEALDGNSLQLEATAVIDGISIPFVAAVPIQQSEDTELGVPVIRKSTSDVFPHNVGADNSRLVIRFDAQAWVQTRSERLRIQRTMHHGWFLHRMRWDLERTCDNDIETELRDADSANLPAQGGLCRPDSY